MCVNRSRFLLLLLLVLFCCGDAPPQEKAWLVYVVLLMLSVLYRFAHSGGFTGEPISLRPGAPIPNKSFMRSETHYLTVQSKFGKWWRRGEGKKGGRGGCALAWFLYYMSIIDHTSQLRRRTRSYLIPLCGDYNHCPTHRLSAFCVIGNGHSNQCCLPLSLDQ